MLTLGQMLFRFVVALVLGAILGVERELVRKEAGVRTEMLVAGGAALFTMAGLMLPYLTALDSTNLTDILAHNSGFLQVIANVVVGIGFLGAGLIIKSNDHPHGVTTAALVWLTAAVGILAGAGLLQFATVSALLIAVLLFILRKMNVSERLEKESAELK
ncbi:MAG: MgtC/SapB family protein [Patescibacteria group bacterium]|nr:MgtC/SapB family protein [Patescibacteria group bacterium]